MSEKNPATPRRWRRRLIISSVVVFVPLVTLYAIVTSEPFVKDFVLPRVGDALNADISVSSVQVDPFSRLTLKNARFTPRGAETMVTADSVHVHYSLLSILRGNIKVYHLTAVSPNVTIVWHADGTSNLDPLSPKSEHHSQAPSPSTGPLLDVRRLALQNATFRQISFLPQGGSNVLEFTNVSLTAGGTMDFSGTNIAGSTRLTVEAADLSSFFDFIARISSPDTNQPAAASGPYTEPDAVSLPFRNFSCDLKISRLRVHALDFTNVVIKAQLNDSDITVKPLAFELGSAPFKLTGDLDLGVPGYRYNIDLKADQLPLTPFMDTFEPDAKGQVGGMVSASMQLKGGGFTGTSLRNNLSGSFDVLSTNLNLSIANVRSPILNTIVDVVISVPDILRNPATLVGNWVRDLEHKRKGNGWVDQLTAAPIDEIHVRGNAGNGNVTLQQIEIQSDAFRAEASGDVSIAPDVSQSRLSLPVSIAISRDLAKRADILPTRTSTNAVYIPLPDFLTVKGTLAGPEADINKVRVAELAARAGVGVATSLITALPQEAGSIFKSAGDKLLDRKPAVTDTNLPPMTTTTTNLPPATATKTNPPPSTMTGLNKQ